MHALSSVFLVLSPSLSPAAKTKPCAQVDMIRHVASKPSLIIIRFISKKNSRTHAMPAANLHLHPTQHGDPSYIQRLERVRHSQASRDNGYYNHVLMSDDKPLIRNTTAARRRFKNVSTVSPSSKLRTTQVGEPANL